MEKRDVNDSRSGCFDLYYHISWSIKAPQLCERDSCLCIRGHTLLCCTTQIKVWIWESVMCVSERARARVCIRGGSSRSRDDWICQPAGTLITLAIFRLTSHNHPHLWEGNELGHSGGPDPGRASDSNLFWGKRKSNKQNNTDGVQSVFMGEKILSTS